MLPHALGPWSTCSPPCVDASFPCDSAMPLPKVMEHDTVWGSGQERKQESRPTDRYKAWIKPKNLECVYKGIDPSTTTATAIATIITIITATTATTTTTAATTTGGVRGLLATPPVALEPSGESPEHRRSKIGLDHHPAPTNLSPVCFLSHGWISWAL